MTVQFTAPASNLPVVPLAATKIVIKGTNMDDWLIADPIGNTLYGYDGNDSLNGDIGNDLIFGGTGDDYILGLGGDDTLFGEAGKDTIFGHGGKDTIDGGADNDIIDGGSENDTLLGGDGNDTIKGGSGNDYVFGGKDYYDENTTSSDTLYGGGGNDSVAGTNGKDTLFGDAGNDTLAGRGGNDKLFDGSGVDSVDGGDGNDIMTATNDGFGAVVGEITTQTDRFYGGAGNDFVILKNGVASSFTIVQEVDIPALGAKKKAGDAQFISALEIFWEDSDGMWQRDFIASDVEFVMIGSAIIEL